MLVLEPDSVEKAAAIIKSGGLAAFPTETVYGLGAEAFNSAALARVFEVKSRPRFDPLIIHIAGLDGLELTAHCSALGAEGRVLLEKLTAAFWPGPLTLVVPKRPQLPYLATAGLETAALRFPAHPAALALIRLTGPLAAPSANSFGKLSPTRARHVIDDLGAKIDCIIDGGPCEIGVESTVLSLCSGAPTILRPGGVSREALEALIGPVKVQKSAETKILSSPGMMKSHYAPNTPLFLHTNDELLKLPFKPEEAFLFFSDKEKNAWLKANGGPGRFPEKSHLVLSPAGAPAEAAANFFEYLHRLDSLSPACIHAALLAEEGLGAAINDRLRRAST